MGLEFQPGTFNLHTAHEKAPTEVGQVLGDGTHPLIALVAIVRSMGRDMKPGLGKAPPFRRDLLYEIQVQVTEPKLGFGLKLDDQKPSLSHRGLANVKSANP